MLSPTETPSPMASPLDLRGPSRRMRPAGRSHTRSQSSSAIHLPHTMFARRSSATVLDTSKLNAKLGFNDKVNDVSDDSGSENSNISSVETYSGTPLSGGLCAGFRNLRRRASNVGVALLRKGGPSGLSVSIDSDGKSSGDGGSAGGLVTGYSNGIGEVGQDGIIFPAESDCYEVGDVMGAGATATVHLARCRVRQRSQLIPQTPSAVSAAPIGVPRTPLTAMNGDFKKQPIHYPIEENAADSGPLVPVAIKTINTDLFSRTQIEELRKEIQIMSLCRHPNVLPVYTSFFPPSSHNLWIVTPLMSAGSCLDILSWKWKRGMPEAAVREILFQAMKGLEYLHSCHLVHRDVKAANVLLDQHTGIVQLADFGVSSSLVESHSGGSRVKSRNSFVGTPCWMAPEVIEQKHYDHKADIWSFGITAIELFTGRAPYAKLTPMKVFMMTLQADPPSLEDWEENEDSVMSPSGTDTVSTQPRVFTRAAKEFVRVCLRKNPEDRQDCGKVLKTHPFFKPFKAVRSRAAGKDTSQLTASGLRIVEALDLEAMSPLVERVREKADVDRKRKEKLAEKLAQIPSGETSWDFDDENEESDQGKSDVTLTEMPRRSPPPGKTTTATTLATARRDGVTFAKSVTIQTPKRSHPLSPLANTLQDTLTARSPLASDDPLTPSTDPSIAAAVSSLSIADKSRSATSSSESTVNSGRFTVVRQNIPTPLALASSNSFRAPLHQQHKTPQTSKSKSPRSPTFSTPTAVSPTHVKARFATNVDAGVTTPAKDRKISRFVVQKD